MKKLLLILLSCMVLGCNHSLGHGASGQMTLREAMQTVSELRVGMSDIDAIAIVERHGIQFSGGGGGTMAWLTSANLSDGSELVLDMRYVSRDLRHKGPSRLTGWRVHDRAGKLLREYSLYSAPGEDEQTKTPQQQGGGYSPSSARPSKATP